MNDQELVEILEQKSPQDLTIEEINLLKQRVSQSEELRHAILQHVQLEQCLVEALGRIDVNVDEILDRSRDEKKKRGAGTFIWLLLLLLVCLVGGALYVTFDGPGSEPIKQRFIALLPPQGPQEVPQDPPPEIPSTPEKPVPGSPDSSDPQPTDQSTPEPHKIESLPFKIAASQFARGNVTSDNVDDPDFVSGKSLSFVEYEFIAAEAAEYQLRLRIDAMQDRSMQILINDQRLQDPVADKKTSDPAAQNWYAVGGYHFSAGKNTLRLEAKLGLPHISALALDNPTHTPLAVPKKYISGPWDDGLAGDPVPFELACFDYFDMKKTRPQEEELKEWFATVPKQQSRISTLKRGGTTKGTIEGVVRLKAPWQEDTVLRLSLEEKTNSLNIHFYHLAEGVTLTYSGIKDWSAYVTQRKPGEAIGKQRVLVDQDQRRTESSELFRVHPIELRIINDEIILSRGDILLLTAPFKGLPEDVYLECNASVRGIHMYKGSGHPTLPAPWKIVQQIDRPADLEWQQTLPEDVTMTSGDDGSVTLQSKEGTTPGFIFAKLPRPSWGVVDMLIDGYVPGTGVHLHPSVLIGSDGKRTPYSGHPPHTVGVMMDRTSKSIGLQWQPYHNGSHDMTFPTFDVAAVPYVGQQTWVRFSFMGKRVQASASPDGRHWAKINPFQHLSLGEYDQVGLSIRPNAKNAKITLRKIVVRVPPVLSSLANAKLLQQTPTFAGVSDYGRWLSEVISTLPEGVELADWRRACAVRCIYKGYPENVCNQIGFALSNDQTVRQWPYEKRLALLNEIVTICPPGAQHWSATLEQYKQIAKGDDNQRQFSRSRAAIMGNPDTSHGVVITLDKELLRQEMLSAIYSGRWDDLASVVKQARFFSGGNEHTIVALDSFLPWAVALAAKHRPGIFGSTPPLMKLSWRHPYVEEYNKEAYNVLAEFQSALEGKQFQEACRIVAAIDPLSTRGLLPAVKDKQHLVSLQTAVGIAMDSHPRLHDEMVQQFGPLSDLRVRQAIAAGEVEAVQLATIQFNGTPAASQAHAWLGDRSLAVGQFALAISHYRRAEESAPPVLKRGMAARTRLAAAMLGQEIGQPITYTVHLGDVEMSGSEFEKIVKDMLSHRSGTASSLATPIAKAEKQPVPAATGFGATRKSAFDGPAGDQTNNILAVFRSERIDWAARQMATVRDGDMLYVSNRYQVSAFDLNNGIRKWRCDTLAGKSLGLVKQFPSISMRPVIVGERIFVRQHERKGPVLVSIEKSTGKRLWINDVRHNESLISDPIWAQGRILALAALRTDQDEYILQLNQYSPEDGELLHAHSLVRLRRSWSTRSYCRMTALDDGFLVDLGGVALRCDFHGQVRWARQQQIVPYDLQKEHYPQSADRPLVIGESAIFATPWSASIECVDVKSGNLRWRQRLDDIRRVLGTQGQRLLVAHAGQLTALALEDGSQLWSSATGPLMNARICADGDTILVCRETPVPGRTDQFRPQFVWVDATSGKETFHWTFETLTASHPRLGPLVTHKKKLWVFSYGREDSGTRDLYELVPKGKAEVSSLPQLESDRWDPELPNRLRQAVAVGTALFIGPPPAQIPASGATTRGSCSEVTRK